MKIRSLLIALALLTLLGGGAWYVVARKAAPGGAPAAPAAPAAQGGTGAAPAPVGPLEFAASDLLVLAPGSISRSIPITGTLRPSQQTLVRAKVAGELRDMPIREGMSVKAGQLLARIDTTEFDWRVKEREAQLRSAEAQVDQAARTLANNQQLFDKGFISQSALDNARSGSDVALGTRDAAIAQLTMARKALADTAVLAPLSGVVAERFAQPGEKVSPDNRILSIVDLSRMEIEAPVPASEIGGVRLGQAVTLQIEGVDAPQTGHIVRISPSTSAGTRSIPVYISLDNRSATLRSGLFAQGALMLEARNNIVLVPGAAVREAAGRTFVYVIEGERLLEKTIVTGLRDDAARAANGGTGVVEVSQGLKAGERIVALNLGALRAGSLVRVREAGPAAGGAAGGAASVAPAAAR